MPAKYLDQKPAPTIKRLIALLGAGYSMREQDLPNADNYVSLEHPAHRTKLNEKHLFLYDDGSVMGGPRADDTCLLIHPEDAPGFKELVDATPKPTWWELNNGPFYSLAAWAILISIMLVGSLVIDFVWGVFKK